LSLAKSKRKQAKAEIKQTGLFFIQGMISEGGLFVR